MQNAAVKMLTTKSPFRGQSKFGTWFLRIVINEIQMSRRTKIDIALRHPETPDILLEFVSTKPNPEVELGMSERASQIIRIAEGLPRAQRQNFLLHYVYELSAWEIAQCRGVPFGTIKSSIWHAQRSIRKSLCSSRQPSQTAAT